MKWRTTGILVALAVVLFAFIFFVERRIPTGPQPLPRLVAFRANDVTNIQLRITNQLALRVERAGPSSPWVLTLPLYYPAQPHKIQWMISALESLVSEIEISESELKSSKRTIAEFGLDVPRATLTLQHNGRRTEVSFGAPTPVGNGVYIQTSERPGIYVVVGELAERLPRNHNDWRDTLLFTSTGFQMNRLDLKSGGRTVALEIDRTNKTFVLTKPTVARADPSKVEGLLQKLFSAEVSRFVTDSTRVDLEQYGLQPPEAEVSLLLGTNEQFAVQFGKSPPNEATNVYARRLAQTNIVVVPRATLEAALTPHTDIRDLHVMTFNAAQVDAIEVTGTNGFSVRRQTNGWMITEPKSEAADTNAIRDWLDTLAKLEGTIEKDVVTDFTTTYGLTTPARRYLLKSFGTNSAGVTTNRVIAELDLGNVQDKKAFARRPDEATVYGLSLEQVAQLPRRAWQLRDRRVWSFTTNQVHRVHIRHNGQTRTLQRAPNATWSIVQGSGIVDAVNPVLEHAMERLGELRARFWVDQGDTNKVQFGFNEGSDRIVIELKNGDGKSLTRVLEIGLPGISPTGLPYGMATADGQTWILELWPDLWFGNIVRDLFNPMAAASPP